MILEGIVTTLGPEGRLNIAPMGPQIEPGWRWFTLRPFKTSATYRNLKDRGEGVLHVIDDVLLIARAAIGQPLDVPTTPAETVAGRILVDACRYYEFRVRHSDESQPRASFRVETVAEGRHRDLFGLNRAQHAVVEASILATRLDFLPMEEVCADLDRLAILVEKTGGPTERAAFEMLDHFIRRRERAEEPTP